MSAIPQNILASQRASLDNLVAIQNVFFEGFEKLVDLNLKAARASLEDAVQRTREVVELKDAQDAVSFASGLTQPNAEKALAYGRHVYDIVSGVQADLTRLSEEQISENQKQVSDAIEQFSKNAPVGTESAVALLKSSLSTATSAYESVAKAAKQASRAAESNLAAATNATLKAATDAVEAAKPAARARRAAA
ncbi:MAG: phasin family protein [Candidimonas sp.]|nr:MAG: phasin family protein [Candidimonas sp.]